MAASPLVCSAEGYTVVHLVAPGETLCALVKRYYGATDTATMNRIIAQIVRDNPGIGDPSRIAAGRLLFFGIPFREDAPRADDQGTSLLTRLWASLNRTQQELASALGPNLDKTGKSLDLASGVLDAFRRTIETNVPTLGKIVAEHGRYRAGELSKSAYDATRRSLLDGFQQRLGPIRRLLFGDDLGRKALRILPGRATNPAGPLFSQMQRLKGIAETASRYAIVLDVVSLGITVDKTLKDITHADTSLAKNRLLVERTTSLATGYAMKAVVAVVLGTTPVGWSAALVVGVGTVVVGWAASEAVGAVAGEIYATHGTQFKPVEILGIDRIYR